MPLPTPGVRAKRERAAWNITEIKRSKITQRVFFQLPVCSRLLVFSPFARVRACSSPENSQHAPLSRHENSTIRRATRDPVLRFIDYKAEDPREPTRATKKSFHSYRIRQRIVQLLSTRE